MTELEVGRLIAEREVEAVIKRYARGVDRRDWDAVRACFDPRGVIVGTFGRGSVGEYLPGLIRRVEAFGATMHVIGNQVAEVMHDSATCESYGLAHHFDDERGVVERLVVGVEYRDELERAGAGRWLIVQRTVRTLWERRDGLAATEHI